jgi:hypothetical protein
MNALRVRDVLAKKVHLRDRLPQFSAPLLVRAKSPNKKQGEITMTKNILANRFGLAALLTVSLLASTPAFSATAAAQSVVVTNTTAQSIPIVGLVKDLDGPGHVTFRTPVLTINVPAASIAAIDGTASKFLTTVPAGMRLVIENVSGRCAASPGYVRLEARPAGSNTISAAEFMPGEMFSEMVSAPVKFYADPGEYLYVTADNSGYNAGICWITVTGYYIGLGGF